MMLFTKLRLFSHRTRHSKSRQWFDHIIRIHPMFFSFQSAIHMMLAFILMV